MKKIQKENIIDNYQYDVNIGDELFITLEESKISSNAEHYKKNTIAVHEWEDCKYCIVVYAYEKNTILTFLEDGIISNSQFLIKDENVFEYLKREDLSKYVNYQIIDLLFPYFDY